MNTDQSDTTTREELTFEQLSYADRFGGCPDGLADAVRREYSDRSARYDAFARKRSQTAVSPRTVRWAMAWTVTTIKTDTSRIDARTEMMTGDFGDLKSFVENSTDGQVKWEKVHTWFNSDVPERVAGLIRSGRIHDAHALLAGRDPETMGPAENLRYLRTCKASLVLYLLGIDRMCIDTRIYRTIKPLLKEITHYARKNHPDTEGYRKEAPDQNAKRVPVVSHSGDRETDFSKTFLEDKLKWNPREYVALTDHIVGLIADKSDVPREVVPQVLFNLSGETTFHEDLYEILG